MKKDLDTAGELSIQGSFLRLKNVHIKSTHSIFYNWNIDDLLVKFVTKARLSILPTKFTQFIWNREHNPLCPFGCQHTESISHVLNGCTDVFGNFYSRRHDRIVTMIVTFLKELRKRYRVVSEKNSERVFPLLREEIMNVNHRRPDIHVIDELAKTCIIVEVTVCFDLYLDYAYDTKWKKYEALVECLGKYYEVDLVVLCFGSLGSVRKDVWRHLKRFSSDKNLIKSIMKYETMFYFSNHRIKLYLAS